MVREKFKKPEMDVVTFNAEDIIVTSGDLCSLNCPTDGSELCLTDTAN